MPTTANDDGRDDAAAMHALLPAHEEARVDIILPLRDMMITFSPYRDVRWAGGYETWVPVCC